MEFTEQTQYSYTDEIEEVILLLQICPNQLDHSNKIRLSSKDKNHLEARRKLIICIESSIEMLRTAKAKIEAM